MIERATMIHSVNAKAEILASGLEITGSALKAYGKPNLCKRRAYGNADSLSIAASDIPQEMYIGDQRIICAANFRPHSPWVLDFDDSAAFYVTNRITEQSLPVSFPQHPAYYDDVTEDGFRTASVVTLYGGGALGIFVYGDCSLVQMKKACQYCSIEPNRKGSTEFLAMTSPSDVERAVERALALDNGTISQIMLNGGNLPDLDKSFGYYLKIAEAARRAVDRSGKELPIHLIAFPPSDLSLVKQLAGLNVDIAFNSEVHDDRLFEQYCPGKAVTGGKRLLNQALDVAVASLGRGHVFSIFVGGLEPISSLCDGLEETAGRGVTPVINVFHPDPGTPLSAHPCPDSKSIIAMGLALQDIYQKHSVLEPFYTGCGRNSIDSEAHQQLFR